MELTMLDLSEARRKLMATPLRLNANPEQWTDVFAGLKTASGKMVSRETAIRVTGVLACIRILMEDISTIPLILKRKTARGSEEAIDHPLYPLLKDAPNVFQTSVEVREHLMLDILLTGRFAAWVQRNGKGEILAIYPLHSARLWFAGSRKNGDLVWNYSSPELTREFTQNELWRSNMMSQYIVDGRSLVLLAREAIGLAIAAEEQGARLFSNGIQSNITLSTDAELDDGQKNNLRDAFSQAYAGSSNSWKPLLLENGLTATKIGLTAQESQYLEARKYQLEDIARIFRIPDVLLGISSGKSSTYASAEQFFQAYVKHTIMPWVVRIEQTIQRDLILPGEVGLSAKHQLSHLLRSDTKTRFETYQIGIQAGFMNRNEPREMEEWDTVEGLDEFLTPVNMGLAGQSPTNTTQKDSQTLPSNSDSEAKHARRLAECIASSIIRSETRQFLAKSPSAAAWDNFRAWHVARILDLTGASTEEATAYSTWRCDLAGRDPLADANENQAREKLINLCLGVKL